MLIQAEWKRFLVPFLAIVTTVGALWFTNRAVTPREAGWEDVVAEARAGGYDLINTEDLNRRIEKDSDNILLVDTRQEWEYRAGHIKGAVNFPMEPTWWSRLRKRGALKAALGPDRNRVIVFY